MSGLVLIPWPETSWSLLGRLASRTPLPLTDQGRAQAQEWAEDLAGDGISVIYSQNDCTSVQTARIFSKRCAARHKTEDALREVDSGLWGGLTPEELKRRFPKVFKKWYDDPTSVCPPEGEDVRDAFARLAAALDQIRQKQGRRNVAVVLGPLAFALARCVIESADPAELRTMTHDHPLRYATSDTSAELEATSVGAHDACFDGLKDAQSAEPESIGENHGAG